ncbi:hypothetical protein T4B_11127 [Trichinella pseudospiralis]|uniref:Uncharacterized protein n=1 Tax=Trichinella pseudospiralis TaxID=6337 RepID=A0A0V1JJ71_TRIPS|nr:hypothetical protein T4A_8088 [Trichinella pseudospiralis]KRZ35043.1 hypothetical protein T4B_11127 [Trichinella pseudospiralis]KRZ44003.1 hypothetical protein T4C_845 [Trichinella pseudospiralis]
MFKSNLGHSASMPVVNLISLLLRGIDLKTDKEIVPKKLAILLQTNNTKCKLQKCIWNKVKMKAGKSVLVKAIDKRQNLLSNCPRKPSWTKVGRFQSDNKLLQHHFNQMLCNINNIKSTEYCMQPA